MEFSQQMLLSFSLSSSQNGNRSLLLRIIEHILIPFSVSSFLFSFQISVLLIHQVYGKIVQTAGVHLVPDFDATSLQLEGSKHLRNYIIDFHRTSKHSSFF